MNLLDREAAWQETRAPYQRPELYCPYSATSCQAQQCAHYDPASNECYHVLAIQTKAHTKEALESISKALNTHLAGVAGMLVDVTDVDVDSGDSYMRIRGYVGTKDLDRV